MKICFTCKIEKEDNEYNKNNKKNCKQCINLSRKCEHDKRRSRCEICKENKILNQNKTVKTCKICNIEKDKNEFLKNRKFCKLCYNESRKCEHNIKKSGCRICTPSSFCEHGIIKYRCKDCKGSAICEHNKEKITCRECDGFSFCEHNKFKSTCKDCKGSRICKHNKNISLCKECGGSAYCEHNKFKQLCRECGGSAYCEHNKIKRNCRECGGSVYCEHNRQKHTCKECNGSDICIHFKRKSNCYVCSPNSKTFCKINLCETRVSTKFKGYCSRCFFYTFPDELITRNYKTKENSVADFIKYEFKEYDITFDKKIQDGCTKRRPDILFDFGEKVIIIEVDENQHINYDSTCEKNRLNNLIEDINYRNLILIKFNPDHYKNGNDKIKSCWTLTKKTGTLQLYSKKEWNLRLNRLKEEIYNQINNNNNELFTLISLYYDK